MSMFVLIVEFKNDVIGQQGVLDHNNVTAYLCGHLHGLVPNMHARHNNLLELEVPDWRDRRQFRIMLLDHNVLAFSDATFQQWPVIVVTNPKVSIAAAHDDESYHIAAGCPVPVCA